MTGLREQKKRRTRRDLAVAAVELLVAEGDEGATVAAIAARAGVSTRTFHNYFSAREDAFLLFIEDTIAEWVEQVRSAPEEQTPFEALRAVLVGQYTLPSTDAASAPNLLTIGEHVMAGLGPHARCRGNALFDELRDALVERSGGHLSRFRANAMLHASMAASGVVLDAAREARDAGKDVDVAALLDDAFDFIGGGVDRAESNG
ncbi:TetR/AcrR family transcriptional regulator [uncultured Corynebacterium sp.]|uniref:TetR/AcrR family transcriptional regulator n=1 Tax=uncultured Corynebacterium sp. TaxID=159447 RepID=UPI0025E31139|nr:TetR/AcrR family transcriptional regulator [uncultured Corynebacterium sp.]